MKKFNFDRNIVLIIVGVLFFMSISPGEGTKAEDQQAIVQTEFTCATAADCPVCTGYQFGSELNVTECKDGKCMKSEYCLIWDCGKAKDCHSMKKTLLDNTLEKFNDNPLLLLLIVGLIIALLMLGSG